MSARWSAAENATLAKAFEDGRSYNQCAALFPDRTLAAVVTHIRDLRDAGVIERGARTGRPSSALPIVVAPAPGGPLRPHQAGMRKCLGGCGQPFWSLHAGLRICGRCQHSKERRAAARSTAFDTPHAVRI